MSTELKIETIIKDGVEYIVLPKGMPLDNVTGLQPRGEAYRNPGYCCSQCGQGFDFGCRCPDY